MSAISRAWQWYEPRCPDSYIETLFALDDGRACGLTKGGLLIFDGNVANGLMYRLETLIEDAEDGVPSSVAGRSMWERIL